MCGVRKDSGHYSDDQIFDHLTTSHDRVKRNSPSTFGYFGSDFGVQ